jgi:signal transduction histidine kinase
MAKDDRQRIEEGWVMVEDGIERISGLSYNMLNFAREWKPELQSTDLSEMVVKICEQNRQAAAERGVTLRHEVSDGLPPVLCDPKLIHMAATDIVVNAIDACLWKDYGSDEKPEIVLGTSLGECDDCFVIEVCDNGCGMTDEVRRNIFTPFFSTKESLGTGLGLAVTDKIIRVHEGEISVESQPDRGTTFRIRIPKDGPSERRGGE